MALLKRMSMRQLIWRFFPQDRDQLLRISAPKMQMDCGESLASILNVAFSSTMMIDIGTKSSKLISSKVYAIFHIEIQFLGQELLWI